MHNKLKEIFSAGKQALGMFLELEGHLAAECLGLSGLDFFIADAEHGTFDVKSAAAAIIAGRLRGIEPLVRTQDSTRPSVLKMLDIGAAGLIVPYIQTVSYTHLRAHETVLDLVCRLLLEKKKKKKQTNHSKNRGR